MSSGIVFVDLHVSFLRPVAGSRDVSRREDIDDEGLKSVCPEMSLPTCGQSDLPAAKVVMRFRE
jgi:hypothetical protein